LDDKFAAAGASLCGVAGLVTTAVMVPPEGLKIMSLLGAAGGCAVGFLMADNEADENNLVAIGKKMVIGTAIGATGMFGWGTTAGAVVGALASRPVKAIVHAVKASKLNR